MTDIPESRGGRDDAAATRPGRIVPALFAIAAAIVTLARKVSQMTTSLDDLREQVHAPTSAEQSAVALITGLAEKMTASKDDPAAIESLAAELKQGTSNLASAITANTPDSPVPATSAITTAGDPAAPTASTTSAIPASEPALVPDGSAPGADPAKTA